MYWLFSNDYKDFSLSKLYLTVLGIIYFRQFRRALINIYEYMLRMDRSLMLKASLRKIDYLYFNDIPNQ